MGKMAKKFVLFFTVAALLMSLAPVAARADNAAALAEQIKGIPGLEGTVNDGLSIVNVSGIASGRTTTLTLNISDGVTINWEANYSGSTTTVGALIILRGSGTSDFEFNVKEGAKIENTGTGRTIQAEGSSADIKVSGIVAANSGTAIHTNGQNAAVTVSENGMVYNSATTNAQVTIHMTYGASSGEDDPNTIVTVTGHGSVKSLSGVGNGYAIQTYGSVMISDDAEVFASGTGGRAINVLGAGFVTVQGGTVWSKNGIAICGRNFITVSGGLVYNESSSTGYPVIGTGAETGASVEVFVNETGQVEARGNGGYAISTPGDVVIGNDAKISAATGRGINVSGSGNVTVNGGTVSSTTGNAIHATLGSVTVSGGIVSATTGYAIGGTASKGVTVSGGFVFAYGGNITGNNNVVQRSFTPAAPGAVVAWARPNITPPIEYEVGSKDLRVSPSGTEVTWTGGGISYIREDGGGKKEFFPIPEVIVKYDAGHGLFFDVAKSKSDTESPFTIGPPELVNYYRDQDEHYEWSISGNSGTLELIGFTWNTSIPGDAVALTIVDSNAESRSSQFQLTIELEGDNFFTVTNKQDETSVGIWTESVSLTIEGDGTLNAAGSTDTGAPDNPVIPVTVGIFVDNADITIKGGTVNAIGANYKTGGVGIYVLDGDIIIERGTVTAIGDGPIGGVGIFTVDGISGIDHSGEFYGLIKIKGGTVTAQGSAQAFWTSVCTEPWTKPREDPPDSVVEVPPNFSIPEDSYIYWQSTRAAHPGDSGTLFIAGPPQEGERYTSDDIKEYNPEHKYVRIATRPLAVIVQAHPISGETGKALTGGPGNLEVDIHLYSDELFFTTNRFTNGYISAISWFADMPSGVTVMVERTDGNNIKLTFSGIPASVSNRPFNITIPGNVLSSGADLQVQFNPFARFNIISVNDCGCSAADAGTLALMLIPLLIFMKKREK